MRTLRSVLGISACVAMLTAVGCSAESPAPAPPSGGTEGGAELETEVAEGVVVEVVDNGRRLVVRNQRAEKVLVLDTALQPHRQERSGTLTLIFARPGAVDGGDEPAVFEAVPVEAAGKASIEPGFSLREGDRLRYCLEVVDPANSIGGEGTRVRDREPGEPVALACSSPVTVR